MTCVLLGDDPTSRRIKAEAFMIGRSQSTWDITTSELKEARQQGRKELFYPCGKTHVQTLGEQV
jgi:hypothetical protein